MDATADAVELLAALKLIDLGTLDKHKQTLVKLCQSWCQCVLASKMPLGPLIGCALQKGVPLQAVSATAASGAKVNYVLPAFEGSEGSEGAGDGAGSAGASSAASSTAVAFYQQVGIAAHNVIRELCLEQQVG